MLFGATREPIFFEKQKVSEGEVRTKADTRADYEKSLVGKRQKKRLLSLHPKRARGGGMVDLSKEPNRRLALCDGLGDCRCTHISDFIAAQVYHCQRFTLFDGLGDRQCTTVAD